METGLDIVILKGFLYNVGRENPDVISNECPVVH